MRYESRFVQWLDLVLSWSATYKWPLPLILILWLRKFTCISLNFESWVVSFSYNMVLISFVVSLVAVLWSPPIINKQFLRYFLLILEIFHFNWGTCWNVWNVEVLAWFFLFVAETCIVCDFYPLRRFQLFLKKQFVSFLLFFKHGDIISIIVSRFLVFHCFYHLHLLNKS